MHLCFPLMHPDLLPAAAKSAMPQDLRFLDPGLADPKSAAHLQPEAAPFDRRTAKALLADTLRYGETAASPRDLVAQNLAQQTLALAPEGSGKVQADVERSMLGGLNSQDGGDDPELSARRQAQMLLLLAWSLEERLLELRAIGDSLRASWDRLGSCVSEGEGAPLAEAEDSGAQDGEAADHEALALGRELSGMNPLVDAAPESVPWQTLVEPFALLAPGATLCSGSPEIAAMLADAGVAEAAASTVPGAERVFRDEAWKVMGLQRYPESRPWLAAELTLALFAA